MLCRLWQLRGRVVVNQTVTESPANTKVATIIYVLYLLALVSVFTGVIGVVMAYMYKDGAPEWLRTHYELQIRTFWIGLLYFALGIILCTVLIGVVVLMVATLWWIVRCVKGLKHLDQRTPYPDRLGWGF